MSHTFQAPSSVARPASSAGPAAGGDSSATRRSARALRGPYTCCVADRDRACQIPLPSNANALHVWSQSVPESAVSHVYLCGRTQFHLRGGADVPRLYSVIRGHLSQPRMPSCVESRALLAVRRNRIPAKLLHVAPVLVRAVQEATATDLIRALLTDLLQVSTAQATAPFRHPLRLRRRQAQIQPRLQQASFSRPWHASPC